LGGVLSRHRDLRLITSLVVVVRSCLQSLAILNNSPLKGNC